MTIGERIKARREQLGITQVSLADAINEKKQTLYKYEANIVTNIPIDKIEAIADALGTTPAYIMGWEEEKTADISASGLSQTEYDLLSPSHRAAVDQLIRQLYTAQSDD